MSAPRFVRAGAVNFFSFVTPDIAHGLFIGLVVKDLTDNTAPAAPIVMPEVSTLGIYVASFTPVDNKQYLMTAYSYTDGTFATIDTSRPPQSEIVDATDFIATIDGLLPPNPPPNTCLVSGNVVDIGGSPEQRSRVSFRGALFPMAADSSLVTSDSVFTHPDISGNFQVPLIQGKVVIVEIERTALRFQITIPMQDSANLLDLLPPIPN